MKINNNFYNDCVVVEANDDKLLEKAAAIVKTAEYTGETTNMEIAIPDGVKNLLNQQ